MSDVVSDFLKSDPPESAAVSADLAELSHDLPEEAVQDGQLPAQVDVSLEAACVTDTVQVGDVEQELLHGGTLHLQKLIHETHVLLFIAEPAHGRWRRETMRVTECARKPE